MKRVIVVFAIATLVTALMFWSMEPPLHWRGDPWLFWLKRHGLLQMCVFTLIAATLAVGILGVLSRSNARRVAGAAALALLGAVIIAFAPAVFFGESLHDYRGELLIHFFPK